MRATAPRNPNVAVRSSGSTRTTERWLSGTFNPCFRMYSRNAGVYR